MVGPRRRITGLPLTEKLIIGVTLIIGIIEKAIPVPDPPITVGK